MQPNVLIKNNFLPDDRFLFIEDAVNSNEFPYYWQGQATDVEADGIYLWSHRLFDIDEKGILSNAYEYIIPSIIKNLPDFNKLLRAKVNLYTNQNKKLLSPWHVDLLCPHKVALFSIDTNNGYTEFEDGKLYKSEKNTILLFNGKLKHRAAIQTDTDKRININIDYE